MLFQTTYRRRQDTYKGYAFRHVTGDTYYVSTEHSWLERLYIPRGTVEELKGYIDELETSRR